MIHKAAPTYACPMFDRRVEQLGARAREGGGI
jgi:hypothetical protein